MIKRYAVKNMGVTTEYDTRAEAEAAIAKGGGHTKYARIYELSYARDGSGNLWRPGGHSAAYCYSRFCVYCGTA